MTVCSTIVLALLPGCSRPPDASPAHRSTDASVAPAASSAAAAPAEDWKPQAIADERLHNAWRLTDRVLSGGVPDERSMQALQELGVKTIISVDGAPPDVELAKRYGLRYVHLPHGYDGIPPSRTLELAKAVSELDGPIYLHCHHGKHRSPAAAATACVVAGFLSPSQGLTVLKSAGTSTGYRGLYRNVEQATAADPRVLGQLQVDYRESVPVAPMAEAMVALEKTHDRLTRLSASGWQTPAGLLNVEPAHEALLLEEHFTELLRTEEVDQQPAEFRQLLRDSETAARQLREHLTAAAPQRSPEMLDKLESLLGKITQDCKGCHQTFRDRPRSD